MPNKFLLEACSLGLLGLVVWFLVSLSTPPLTNMETQKKESFFVVGYSGAKKVAEEQKKFLNYQIVPVKTHFQQSRLMHV